MGVKFRQFDLLSEDPKGVFALYRRTYGQADSFMRRWMWEYVGHPRRQEIAIFVAEEGAKIVGSTSRLPIEVKVGSETVPAFFCVDSMVDPEWRGRGIMSSLYRKASTLRPLHYSKGTAPEMARVLGRLGNRVIKPDTFQTALLDPVKWLLWKGRLLPDRCEEFPVVTEGDNGFSSVVSFGAEFEEFWQRVSVSLPGGIPRSSAYMNWRYVDIPHRTYGIYCRRNGERIVSLTILGVAGRTGSLVDLLWDGLEPDEPACTLHFSKKVMRRAGAVKLVAWGTLESFRRALSTAGFLQRNQTPRFSVWGGDGRFAAGGGFHFVHGDGDLEFL